MNERIVRANGIDIYAEHFGDPSGPPVLLVMGASSQGLIWPDELVQGLVDNGRFVIRYDNRDTGRSTCFDFEKQPYTLDDMALDAVGVLDAYGIDAAHVAGASMGGMITQLLVINHRSRVKSAVMIMTTPLAGGGDAEQILPFDGELTAPDPRFLEKVMEIQLAPTTTREDKIRMRIETFAAVAGSVEPFDRIRQRALAEREVDRAASFDAIQNHGMAVTASFPADRRPALSSTDVPTLVIHGTDDPMFPVGHGRELAKTIPTAELMLMKDAGHEFPRCYINEMVERMVELQNAASRR